MKRLAAEDGFSLIDLTVGLVLFGIVLLSVYALYRPTFALSRDIDERLGAQQDIRLAVDRLAPFLRETTTVPGRMRIYSADSGCRDAFDACIGFPTARDGECGGSPQLADGAPDWRAIIYVWRDTGSRELRLRCDSTTAFPAEDWPPRFLAPYKVIATRVVASSFAFAPEGSETPTSVAVALGEEIRAPGKAGRPMTFFNRTVFTPQNR